MDYRLSDLSEQVTTARANYRPIEIVGGASKRFYGNPARIREDNTFHLEMSLLSGVVHYEPSELVLTAWAGTPLAEIEQLLNEHNQMLAFDPPQYAPGATLGGAVAAGISGPASFGYGPLRHYVLGARLLDAQGRVLRFGGEVMKNVAGYDVSRLLAGSLGMFGALVELSVKVMPKPASDQTCALTFSEEDALSFCQQFRASTWPVKAAAWIPDSLSPSSGTLCVRLSGSHAAVAHGVRAVGGQTLTDEAAAQWWCAFRDQTHPFFEQRPLWRVAVRALTPAFTFGASALDLGGEIRWLVSDHPADEVRAIASQSGGHATLFRYNDNTRIPPDGVFHPLQPGVHAVVRRLKGEFDPKGVFNPGRLVLDL